MFCQDDANETINAAVKAGVSAYVVDGLHPRRIKPILQAAVARSEAFRNINTPENLHSAIPVVPPGD